MVAEVIHTAEATEDMGEDAADIHSTAILPLTVKEGLLRILPMDPMVGRGTTTRVPLDTPRQTI